MCPLSAKFHPLFGPVSAKNMFQCLAQAETAGVCSPKSGVFQLKGVKQILSWEDSSVVMVHATQKQDHWNETHVKPRSMGAGFSLN